ncbi:Cytochrome P450 monooxygenase cicH [Exophiala dermatitidis]
MEQEMDVQGIINAIEGRLAYNSVVGEAPVLHKYLLGNPVGSYLAGWIPSLARLNSSQYIVRFAAKQLERYSFHDKSTDSLRDMLARFKRSRDGDELMTNDDLLSHASSKIDEIDDMDRKDQLSKVVTFAEASRMKYLQACMKEAMRMHPAVGQLLERIVPSEGFEVRPSLVLPAGTIVGINPWLSGRDREVYGKDIDQFRPERWLEADDATLQLMERNFLAFGSGARTCLGKNISLLEMSKLVPQILRNYDVTLSDPSAEWVLADYWFVKQSNVFCRLDRRKTT